MGKQIFVPSMVNDSVTAYHTETGREHWRFFADAPVRLAPIARNGKVYFVNDDGYLYCLSAVDGNLLWKFRGGLSGKKVLGNGRLVNENPARGGPVFYDGKIYLAAGIYPFLVPTYTRLKLRPAKSSGQTAEVILYYIRWIEINYQCAQDRR